MPALLTHYLFANEVISKDLKHRNLALTSSQGPDIFFYNGYSLAKRKTKKEVRAFGNFLHGIDPAPLYKAIIDYAKTKQGEEKEIIYAHLIGMLCHYALDRTTHPYIFYKTLFPGYEKKDSKYTLAHAAMETYLDVIYRDKYHFKKSSTYALKAPRREIIIVSKMYGHIGPSLYDNKFITDKTYYQSWKDMKTAYRLALCSLHGIKKKLLEKKAPLSLANCMCPPKKIPEKWNKDYLNLAKKEWYNPASKVSSSLSFYELQEEAKTYFQSLENFVKKVEFSNENPAKLEDLIKNINHKGTLPDAHMIYFDCIFIDK